MNKLRKVVPILTQEILRKKTKKSSKIEAVDSETGLISPRLILNNNAIAESNDKPAKTEFVAPMVLEEFEKDIDFQIDAHKHIHKQKTGDEDSVVIDKPPDLYAIKETEEDHTPRSPRIQKKKTSLKGGLLKKKTLKLLEEPKGDARSPSSRSRMSLKTLSNVEDKEKPLEKKKTMGALGGESPNRQVNHEDNADGKARSSNSIKSIGQVTGEDGFLQGLVQENIERIQSDNEDLYTSFDEVSDDEDDEMVPFEEERYRDDEKYKNLKWIIFPDDPAKGMWDILIAINLMYTATFIPYVVAFVDDDQEWLVVLDYIFNVIWGIDLVLNFFSAYEDSKEEIVVDKWVQSIILFERRKLQKDAVSIFPFSLILETSKSYNSLARIARLPRLSRFLKLARMLKFFKERSKILQYLTDWLKLRPGIDRFAAAMFYFFLFCHITSAIWYIQADFNSDDPQAWVNIYPDEVDSNFHAYIASFYFVVTTVVTVGYGDIHAHTTTERLVCCIIMFVGAFIYSYIVGSLSTMILSMDTRSRELDSKLKTLINIKQQYSIESQLYSKIRRALKYGHTRFYEDKLLFLQELPTRLRTQLSIIMHKDLLRNIQFFKGRNPNFLGIIGPLLKPIHLSRLDYVFTEGEYANEMYFIKSGEVEIVLKNFNNLPFMKIDQGFYFGEVDLLFNETREYSYRAKSDCELLSLSKKNFEKIFIQEFRQIGMEIQNNALKRRERVRKRYKEALAYCLNEANKTEQEKQKISTDSSHSAISTVLSIDNKHAESPPFNGTQEKVFRFKEFVAKALVITPPPKVEPQHDSKTDSFKIQGIDDVIRTPKRRLSIQIPPSTDSIEDKGSNSDVETSKIKESKRKAPLSAFAKNFKIEGEKSESDNSPFLITQESTSIVLESTENANKHDAKLWAPLKNTIGQVGVKGKLSKSISTNNIKRLVPNGIFANQSGTVHGSPMAGPSNRSGFSKFAYANKFAHILDSTVKKKKESKESLTKKVDRLELMLDEIISHFGERINEVQSQPDPSMNDSAFSINSLPPREQSISSKIKKAVVHTKEKVIQIDKLKIDPSLTKVMDISEENSSSNDVKKPKLNIQSNELLTMLKKPKNM